MDANAERPFISVIIPNYNGAAYIETCVHSLLRQTFRNFEIIIVDNASSDGSAARATALAPSAKLLRSATNLGFAAAVNSGVAAARGEWVALLNNDTEVSASWLAECVAGIERHADAAFLASRILDFRERDRVYSAGDCFLRAGIGYRRGQELEDRDEFHVECEVFAPCGCSALYRKSVLQAVGGFDESFFAYLEDVELGLRLRAAGHKGYFVPGAEVFHVGGGTSGGEFSPLAVRLRTRNALLLILKALPGRILLCCAPMILTSQLFWVARVIARKRLLSYLLGLAGVLPLAPQALRHRRELRRLWKESRGRLWTDIVRSEELARRDFRVPAAQRASLFLRLYFRVFRKPAPLLDAA
jgi:GT2 family glycosyltransferase